MKNLVNFINEGAFTSKLNNDNTFVTTLGRIVNYISFNDPDPDMLEDEFGLYDTYPYEQFKSPEYFFEFLRKYQDVVVECSFEWNRNNEGYCVTIEKDVSGPADSQVINNLQLKLNLWDDDTMDKFNKKCERNPKLTYDSIEGGRE